MEPLVSIIIPTYNRAQLIGETLNSVLAQTYKNWECIVVDDGSSDTTEAIVNLFMQQDSRFHYVHRKKNYLPGGNGARNYGFSLAKGKYIQFFDSDDIMHPEKLEQQVSTFEIDESEFSVCQLGVFSKSINEIERIRHPHLYSENKLEDFIQQKIVFLLQSCIYKASFLRDNHIVFNEGLQAAQDWEFNVRCIYYSKSYSVIDDSLAFIRNHPDNISSSPRKKGMRFWNYYIARNLVFQFLRKEKYPLHNGLETFFKDYFNKVLLSCVKTKKWKESYTVFFKSIIHFYGIGSILGILVSMTLVMNTNRGNRYLKKFLLE